MSAALHSAEPLPRPAEPLQFLSRVVLTAVAPSHMRSLPVHLASTLTSLSAYLGIRGETGLQHYYAEAVTLTCLQPTSSDLATYESLLRSFMLFDRRRPTLAPVVKPGAIAISEASGAHFVQSVADQAAFQSLYESARQLDRYGVMARPRRKIERIILFARELAGQSLLAPMSPPEELYARLCGAD